MLWSHGDSEVDWVMNDPWSVLYSCDAEQITMNLSLRCHSGVCGSLLARFVQRLLVLLLTVCVSNMVAKSLFIWYVLWSYSITASITLEMQEPSYKTALLDFEAAKVASSMLTTLYTNPLDIRSLTALL